MGTNEGGPIGGKLASGVSAAWRGAYMEPSRAAAAAGGAAAAGSRALA
jgi:hypothetical protein